MISKLGELLIEKGLISQEQLKLALEEQKTSGEALGKILVKQGILKEDKLLLFLALQLSIPFFPSLKEIFISTEVIQKIPIRYVWRYKFVPLKIEGTTLTVAVSDPLILWPVDDLRLHLGLDVRLAVSLEEEIDWAIKHYYGVGAETVEDMLDKDQIKEEDPNVFLKNDDLSKTAEDASIVKFVNQLLLEAIKNRATDIHMEPYKECIKIRTRVDGILYDMSIPDEIRHLFPAIVSRIKIISGLDVIEKRLPQDGSATVIVEGLKVDLRISILPAIYGENVVIRVLPSQLFVDLKSLGLLPIELGLFEELLYKQHGIIFLTGPTGSGKTTTLYAFLNEINSTDSKIITIEDPVEYELGGITQIQVNPKINLNFSTALRSILRHDPDVIMVGEVRDVETAKLSIQAALTGHLVFSTLHTNDAPSAANRLIDMEIEPYLVASSVNAFIAQRLVRTICTNCKEINNTALSPLLQDKISKNYYGKGCEVCYKTGYKGRTAIYEILTISEPIRELILKKATGSQVKKKAQELGMKTLLEYGLEKINEGVTTVEEVLRVTEIE
ncbi:MAG: ATPase, T2SS/T4P/T4SS family [bacterium]